MDPVGDTRIVEDRKFLKLMEHTPHLSIQLVVELMRQNEESVKPVFVIVDGTETVLSFGLILEILLDKACIFRAHFPKIEKGKDVVL
jgi:hypothetical protein